MIEKTGGIWEISHNPYNNRPRLMPNMGEVTTLIRAAPNVASLRTTVPMSVVKQWKLKDGDKFEWEWKVVDGRWP